MLNELATTRTLPVMKPGCVDHTDPDWKKGLCPYSGNGGTCISADTWATLTMGKRVRTATVTRDRQSSTGRLRAVPLGEGLPDLERMRSEIDDMTAVLMGREDPPVEAGIMSLLEVADAYYARAAELTMLLQRAEQEGHILRVPRW